MAVNVQNLSGAHPTPNPGSNPGLPRLSMNRDFQNRFTVVLLTLLTGAAVVFAWINFQKRDFQVPYDGVRWLEQDGSLAADRVEADGPGAKAGIKKRRPSGGSQPAPGDRRSRTEPPVVQRRALVESNLLVGAALGAVGHGSGSGPRRKAA